MGRNGIKTELFAKNAQLNRRKNLSMAAISAGGVRQHWMSPCLPRRRQSPGTIPLALALVSVNRPVQDRKEMTVLGVKMRFFAKYGSNDKVHTTVRFSSQLCRGGRRDNCIPYVVICFRIH